MKNEEKRLSNFKADTMAEDELRKLIKDLEKGKDAP